MSIEAMKQAEKLLVSYQDFTGDFRIANLCGEAITALHQAIEQAEKQEPVANRSDCGHKEFMPLCQMCQAMGAQAHSYTTPPEVKNWQQIAEYRLKLMFDLAKRKEWVGLTDEEVSNLWFDHGGREKLNGYDFAQSISAKLKEKNT